MSTPDSKSGQPGSTPGAPASPEAAPRCAEVACGGAPRFALVLRLDLVPVGPVTLAFACDVRHFAGVMYATRHLGDARVVRMLAEG